MMFSVNGWWNTTLPATFEALTLASKGVSVLLLEASQLLG